MSITTISKPIALAEVDAGSEKEQSEPCRTDRLSKRLRYRTSAAFNEADVIFLRLSQRLHLQQPVRVLSHNALVPSHPRAGGEDDTHRCPTTPIRLLRRAVQPPVRAPRTGCSALSGWKDRCQRTPVGPRSGPVGRGEQPECAVPVRRQ